jgi:hypothetical protein
MTPIQLQQLANQLAGLMAHLMLLFLLAFGLNALFGSIPKGRGTGFPKGEEWERGKRETALMPHVGRTPALGEGKIAAPTPSPSEDEFELRYFPDSCEQCEESMRRTGLREELGKAFKEAQARAKANAGKREGYGKGRG